MNPSPRLLLSLLIPLGFALSGVRAADETDRRETITLEQAYDRTLATDQSIRVAYLEVRKARLLPWSALTRLGPQINASAGYDRGVRRSTAVGQETVSTDDNGLPVLRSLERTTRNRSGAASAGFTVQQPLIDLTVFPAYRFGKLSAEAARLQARFTIRGTLYGVVQAYYNVLEQQRLVVVNRQTLQLSKEQMQLAQKRANAGEVTRSDVLRAEVAFQAARRVLIESENLLDSRKNILGNILNFAPNYLFAVAEPPDFSTARPPFQTLLQRAFENREDLRVQDLEVQKDIALKNVVIGQYGPRVVAQFDQDLNNTTGTNTSQQRNWQAGVSVEVPIFTGGQREIDLATAKLKIQQTQLDRDSLAKSIEQEVKDAWLLVGSLEETLKALAVQVSAAQQGYADLENQYREGAATSVDVLTALNDLNTARKDLAVQTYTYQVALRNLEQVSGVFQESRVKKAKIR